MFSPEWPVIQLGKLCEVMESGFAREPNDSGEGVIQLRMPNISDEGFVDLSVAKRVHASPAELETYRMHRGDIIFNNTNSPDKVGNAAAFDVDEVCLFSNHMTRLRLRLGVAEPAFIALVLHAYWRAGYCQKQSKHWVNQAAVDQLTLSKFLIPAPPLSEQRRIVEVLWEVEEVRLLRDAAQRQSAQLIPALFHEMFGDPPWQNTVPLGDAVDFVGGGTPSRLVARYFEGKIPWATSKDIKRDYLDDAEEHITDEAIEASATNLVPVGTLLLVVKSKILMHSLPMAIITRPFCFGQDLKGLVCREGFTPEFVRSALAVQRADVLRRARGVNTEGFTIEALRRIPIPRVTPEQMKIFQDRVWEVRDLGKAETRIDDLLNELRTASLSHAFTGELTAGWRGYHARELAREARQRDEALRAITGRAPALRAVEDPPAWLSIFEQRRDGPYAELSKEQRHLLSEIDQAVGGLKHTCGFTAELLSRRVSGLLRGNERAIQGHLEVFAARGLLIAVSRERQRPMTGETEYAAYYRLPLAERASTEAAAAEQSEPDRVRGREMQRLADAITRERA